ncbi:sugar phosphate isomerase/epimerase family protein [Pelagibacterium lacus]|uniref:Xylose isomerase n=1 Tax=Pelagibacterium lacus TaxID=2282655 RepID=A0A369W2G0_9HYPH|nr:sugar phosphate isomerase/epimerase family protein [Pelagibacterium lacus]RDE08866.1 xylose isomerase [Pelagibacterium lacus]
MALSLSNVCGMNFHYMRHPLRSFLDDAAALGLTRVEIWGAAPHFYIGDNSLAAARELGREVRARGMALACFTPEQCVYPINLGSSEPVLRDRSQRYFLECLEMCVEMGSPALLVTPGSGYANQPAEEAWARCVASLALLADRAERLGITLFFEALPPAWSNIAVTAPDVRRMLDAVASPALKGMMDTSAARLTREDVGDFARALGADLAHMHMTDADDGGAHLAWGDGILDLDAYIADLNAAGYDGALSLEITNARYYLDPMPAMRKSVEALAAAIARAA